MWRLDEILEFLYKFYKVWEWEQKEPKMLAWSRYAYYSSEYIYMLIYVLVALALTCILILLAYLVTKKDVDFEKLSAYECGFESLDDARKTYDIHFFLVGVLFLIFDFEIALLTPWAVVWAEVGLFGFFVMLSFIAIVTLGYVYEWSRGALEWSSAFKYN